MPNLFCKNDNSDISGSGRVTPEKSIQNEPVSEAKNQRGAFV